jgi:periplasmic protein TonB
MRKPKIVGTRRGHMPRFLLTSLGLHVGILLPWMPVLELSGNRETVLTVSLAAPMRPENQAREPATRLTTVEKQKIMAMSATPSGGVAPSVEPQGEASTENSLAKETDTGNARSETARAQIQARLLADLYRHFEYPLLARRLGWQGTVLLAFTLEPDGALQRIHVARSSGYDVLDDSAITALKRVGRLSEARHWLNGQAFEMRVPVIYKLKDN